MSEFERRNTPPIQPPQEALKGVRDYARRHLDGRDAYPIIIGRKDDEEGRKVITFSQKRRGMPGRRKDITTINIIDLDKYPGFGKEPPFLHSRTLQIVEGNDGIHASLLSVMERNHGVSLERKFLNGLPILLGIRTPRQLDKRAGSIVTLDDLLEFTDQLPPINDNSYSKQELGEDENGVIYIKAEREREQEELRLIVENSEKLDKLAHKRDEPSVFETEDGTLIEITIEPIPGFNHRKIIIHERPPEEEDGSLVVSPIETVYTIEAEEDRSASRYEISAERIDRSIYEEEEGSAGRKRITVTGEVRKNLLSTVGDLRRKELGRQEESL